MGQRAPPTLKWYICQLCRGSPACPLSAADARIAKDALETLACSALASLTKKARIKQLMGKFFQSDAAKSFRVCPQQSSCPNEDEDQYCVNVVPVLLSECGMDLSVDAWQDILSSLQQCLQYNSAARVSGNMLLNHAPAEREVMVCDGSTGVESEITLSDLASTDDGATECDSNSCQLAACSQSSYMSSISMQAPVPWFESLSRDELIAKINERDIQMSGLRQQLDRAVLGQRKPIEKLQQRLQTKQNECRNLRRASAKQDDKVICLQKKLDTMKTMIIARRSSRLKRGSGDSETCDRGWLTPNGIIQIGIKRNLAHCASEHLQLLIQQDISRWTVSRSFAAQQSPHHQAQAGSGPYRVSLSSNLGRSGVFRSP